MPKPVFATDVVGGINEQDLCATLEIFTEHIDAALVNARGSGLKSVRYIVPSVFNIGNIPAADAQLVVYSELILLYRGRGFTNIEVDLPLNSFILSWEYGLPTSDAEKRRALVAQYSNIAAPPPRRNSIAPTPGYNPSSPGPHSPHPTSPHSTSPVFPQPNMARRGSSAGFTPAELAHSPITRTPPMRGSPLARSGSGRPEY